MTIKEVLWTTRGKIALGILVLILVLAGIAVYITLRQGKMCDDYECFKESMASCSKATYINDMPEATWKYRISGASNGECVINVKMLQAKKGTIDMSRLAGYSMDCSYSLGVTSYPESDLSKCHGRLKEELQDVIIKKLYSYIIENIGQVSESLKNAV